MRDVQAHPSKAVSFLAREASLRKLRSRVPHDHDGGSTTADPHFVHRVLNEPLQDLLSAARAYTPPACTTGFPVVLRHSIGAPRHVYRRGSPCAKAHFELRRRCAAMSKDPPGPLLMERGNPMHRLPAGAPSGRTTSVSAFVVDLQPRHHPKPLERVTTALPCTLVRAKGLPLDTAPLSGLLLALRSHSTAFESPG